MLRGCALAEATWTATIRDWNNFLPRLDIHRKRLDAMNVPYFWEPMSNAIQVAKWQTNSYKNNTGVQVFDVTKHITGNEFYEFTFHTATGDNFIVESAELICEGKVVAVDKHNHTTTIDPRRPNQFYHLRLNDFKKGRKYQLRITTKMSSQSGSTTIGVAMLIPPLGDNYSDKAGPNSPANGQKYKAPDVK